MCSPLYYSPSQRLAGTTRMASDLSRCVASCSFGSPAAGGAVQPLLGLSTQRSDARSGRQLVSLRPTPSNDRPEVVIDATYFAMSRCDVVLLMPDPNPGSKSEAARRRNVICARCRFVGLQVSIDRSRDEDEKIVKLSATDEVLEEMAERITMEKRLKMGGYSDFRRDIKRLFAPATPECFFSTLERCRLILCLLELGLAEGGCDIDIDRELRTGVLTAVVPMHEEDLPVGRLFQTWALAPLKAMPDQPLDDIRDYFGEQVAIYFAFLQTLTKSLIAPAIVGLLAVCGYYLLGSADNVLCPLYSICILIWITAFIKAWKREEAKLAFRWNVEDFEETERERREFRGPMRRGIYTREGYFVGIRDDDPKAAYAPLTKKFEHSTRKRRMLVSLGAILPFVAVVVCGVIGVLVIRSLLTLTLSSVHTFASPLVSLGDESLQSYAITIGSVLGGVLNALYITVTNSLYAMIAVRLNEWENHRTETANIDALIVKTFCFQFINSYGVLFYIAFVKSNAVNILGGLLSGGEYCHDPAHFADNALAIKAAHDGYNPFCLTELSVFLSSYVVTIQVINKIHECVCPKMAYLFRTCSEERSMFRARRHVVPMTFCERQAKLDVFEGVFNNYSFLTIQVGYIVLFAPAFPIASLVCYVSFIFKIRADAHKLLESTQRPRYVGAQDIGSWMKVLQAIGVVGVFTNMGLIGYTTTWLSASLPMRVLGFIEVTVETKATFLFLCEHVILAVQLITWYAIPDLPEIVAKVRARFNWRKKATIELAKSVGKPVVIDGTAAVRTPYIEWDDDVIPDRFWKDGAEVLVMEPRQGREWAKLVKAGEYMSSEAGREAAFDAARERYCSVHAVTKVEAVEPNNAAAAAQLAFDRSPANERLALLQA